MNILDEHDAIRDLNISYLWLAQKLLKSDRAMAMFRLGVTPEIASVIEELPIKRMMNLASAGQLVCVLRLNRCGTFLALSKSHASAEIAHLHAAAALASSEPHVQDAT
ncbi:MULTISPECIES: flagellar transcriptional regulator FlhD [Burkholderia]|uniref:flagellar transcriptional regulator FlhD n=1 Tax=Burkholderia TaxID=32008 RepID=UPI00158184DF|nr:MULTISPECIES: flagellar transcriptional regulator FlhD [Burkholderia]MBN3744384.1 flagellar transcriptional activator FlhD [Burkholderia sp. Se-20373]MBN3771907.1 flagellar transcriptional activator FlhD [Burkholderia sp. Se-20378]MBN3793666.1 flagellar transcriptional activator FlhD [Burkholderia sp. Ac-20392]